MTDHTCGPHGPPESQLAGSTWSAPRRRRGIGAFAATLAAAAMATAAVAIPNLSGDDVDAVGVLQPSMIEMLGNSGDTNVLTLAELRYMIAGTSQASSTGTGVDVAVIDTGVSPVPGLDGQGKVLHGPDLSFEGSSPEVAYLDTYGHGTHMAGIIAGSRSDAPGIAPGARIVSLKVAGNDGVTTVPQVVAAIDWVIEHRNTDGLNIRVLNLSLGQAGIRSHVGDPLSAAVERAWKAGILVVVAGGNRGETQKHLDSPAINPYVVAVGAASTGVDRRGRITYDVPDWSAWGDRNRDPDAVAPGVSIASYRVPGSTVDQEAPHARYGDGFFLGSGTSQAAAMTSGLAAALYYFHPYLTPDEAKAAIQAYAIELDSKNRDRDGEGAVQGATVSNGAPHRVDTQNYPSASGNGSGIVEPTGATWSGGEWSGATWSGATWSGTVWSGATWSGATWSGATWSGATWSGATWSGATWSGATWSGATWSGATWSGATWSGSGWS